jgi:hypothetical protein
MLIELLLVPLPSNNSDILYGAVQLLDETALPSINRHRTTALSVVVVMEGVVWELPELVSAMFSASMGLAGSIPRYVIIDPNIALADNPKVYVAGSEAPATL